MSEYRIGALVFSVLVVLCTAVGFVNASYHWPAKESWVKRIVRLCVAIASALGLLLSVMVVMILVNMNK